MNAIETLDILNNRNHKRDIHLFLHVEKYMVEQNFDWLSLKIKGKCLYGEAYLSPTGSKGNYLIQVYFSPFLWSQQDRRYERIFIKKPNIKFNSKIHMYSDKALCLYYPNDYVSHIPLFKCLVWTSEWLLKYEYFKKKGVWIGEEVKH